jgi:nucleoside-diphosphate-sugar epimerase
MKSHNSPVNLLTGGTGFLGSHIGAELLRKGQEIIFLIRGNRKTGTAERLEKILDWHGVSQELRSRAHLVEGELGDFGHGFERLGLQGGIDRVIHCASDTSFSERNRKRVWSANVDNMKSLLDFVVKGRIPSFIHVSTAYVAGKRSGPCAEEAINNLKFFNVYEESKAAAERMLLNRCGDEGIRLTILRPSIVYGHSRTGKTFRFNALYYPVKTALFLRKIFVEDIRERGGRKAAEAGVTLKEDGTTMLPLRIDVGKNGGVNLIPIDFFLQAFFALTENSPNAGIYHIVNPRQTRITDIIDYAQNQFKLRGIRACGPEEFERIPPNSLEQLFARYLEAYSPYMKDLRLFSTDKSGPILKRHRIACPVFDANIFQRCMSYAVEREWTGLSV